MAAFNLIILIHVLLTLHTPVEGKSLIIENKCDYNVWPVVWSTRSNSIYTRINTGFYLAKGKSKTIDIQGNWTGRVWGRTLCSNNVTTGNFSCQTGECGSGKIDTCSTSSASATTLAEFTFDTATRMDFYDVSLVDGFNIPLNITPQGGTGRSCSTGGCPVDLNSRCPNELQLIGQGKNNEGIIGCKSPCDVFKTDEYCCATNESSPSCPISSYTLYFAKACPQAYSYAMDDFAGSKSCDAASTQLYTITFCPSQVAPPPHSTPGAPPTLTPPPPEQIFQLKIVIPVSIGALFIIIVLLGVIYHHRTKKKSRKFDYLMFERDDGDDSTVESLQCSLSVLQIATNNFSNENMIGRGGFGVVYKGTLPNGKHIAVKKLLVKSGKVEEEFKNEMKVVAKLQHKNLVRLLAFCLEGDERLLVFEYIPNKSLDYFIFDVGQQEVLDWPIRFNIIEGIARGLLYLHEDSRLTIIHRDLKPSNILLDFDKRPKIADFGMARIFGRDQTGIPNQANGTSCQYFGVDQTHQSTSRAGGTLGYMAPEYVRTLRFSVKTDVYSFGVLVLEIISGKRNSTFHRSGIATDLLSYAWTQLREGSPLALMDPKLRNSYNSKEVIRCIHLGLLCVQKDPNARPSMSNVVHIMLNITSTDALPMPQLPAFYTLDDMSDGQSSSTCDPPNNASVNKVSITELYPR